MKKSMKKSVFLIAVFSVLMLLFAGCSNSSGGDSGSGSENSATEQTSEERVNGKEDSDDGNKDDSGKDDSGKDDSGKDDSGNNNSGEDDSGDNNSGDNNSGEDNSGEDDSGENNSDDENENTNEENQNQNSDDNEPDILEPTYVYFGLYPQTEKAADVEILNNSEVKINGWDAYEGSDGAYYVKWTNKYGEQRYLKIEPIKWRVLTNKFDHDMDEDTPGVKLLVADKILDACKFYDYDDVNRYEQVGNDTIYPNNYYHSRVRAFLNGLSYVIKESDSTNATKNYEFLGNGFLQKAFSIEQINDIATTWVDNHTDNITDITDLYTGVVYRCDSTEDKIFLLSASEVTNSKFRFAEDWLEDEERVRTPTDYASINSFGIADGGRWYLRSPYIEADTVRWIDKDGKPYVNFGNVDYLHGIVPALCLTSDEHLEDNNIVPSRTAEYMFFGSYPQSKKSDSVTIASSSPNADVRGLPAYGGSDGAWYVKLNGEFFKIEPIKWRVVTDNYDHDKDPSTPGKRLLLADSSLYTTSYYEYRNANRTLEGNTIYLNNYEHSRVRAYLNGLKYLVKEDNDTEQTYNTEFEDNGFLQNAFTPSEFNSIAETIVDNSISSLFMDGDSIDDSVYYACADTTDKVFLLSQKEVTMLEYGFADGNVDDSTRFHEMTDYSKNMYGWSKAWWLRSPAPAYYSNIEPKEVEVYNVWEGQADYSYSIIDQYGWGVVPAICLE